MLAEHLILTRFSVRATPDAPLHSDDWLEYRLALFAAYCLPGLAAQTSDAFRWFVFCDSTTATWCIDRLRALAEDVPQMNVEPVSTGASALAGLRPRINAKRILITTRVDSDDATRVDLVERIAAYDEPFAAAGLDTAVVNFSRGYKLDTETGRVYETFHPQSPHLTLFERLDTSRAPVTVQSGNHGHMQEKHLIHTDVGTPAWVQVVHGNNLSNHVDPTDQEVDPASLEGFLLDEVAAPDARRRPAPPQPKGTEARAAFRQALEESL